MKQLIKFKFIAFAAVLVMTACDPQEFDDYKLGESYSIVADQVLFDMIPGSDAWTYNYVVNISVDPAKYPYSYEVRFGDGGIAKDLSVRPDGSMSGNHEYIVAKGTYTAQCIVYTPNGEVAIKEKVITIAEDNEKMYKDDPASLQFALSGGKENTQGKEWYLGAWTAMRNPDNRGEIWWDFKDPAIMDDIFTFKPNSIQPNGAFAHENNGNSFMNESLGTLFPDGDPAGSFITENYFPPKDASWSVSKRDGKTFLTINKGFFGYATAPEDLQGTEFEVISFSPTSIQLVLSSGWDGWCFELVSEVPSSPLTGEGSKTWIIDADNTAVAEVKAALGANIKGFMGLGPLNSNTQEWWGAGPGEKSYENTLSSVGHGWTLFDWKVTFTSTGAFKVVTAGEGYGRAALDGDGFTSIWKNADDMAFEFNGGDFNYTIANASPNQILTLSGNAFFGYYVGTQEYEILYLSETALAISAHNTKEGQDWVFIFIPE